MVEQVKPNESAPGAQQPSLAPNLCSTPMKADKYLAMYETNRGLEDGVEATPMKEANLSKTSIRPATAPQGSLAQEMLCENEPDDVELL